jgi:beta-phosphoglucomutase-like phosphatase (HAD superfamily)
MTVSLSPPEPYSALIFDCDGTLADTMPGPFRSWSATLQSFGAHMSEQQFYALAGVPAAEIIALLNREHGYNLDVEIVARERERHYADLDLASAEIKVVADIARANTHLPMAVASGNLRPVVDKTLKSAGLLHLFSTIVTAEDVQHGKPAPDVFLLAAQRLGVAPADCVVYEDADLGLEAARRAGMRAVDVRPYLELERQSHDPK